MLPQDSEPLERWNSESRREIKEWMRTGSHPPRSEPHREGKGIFFQGMRER